MEVLKLCIIFLFLFFNASSSLLIFMQNRTKERAPQSLQTAGPTLDDFVGNQFTAEQTAKTS